MDMLFSELKRQKVRDNMNTLESTIEDCENCRCCWECLGCECKDCDCSISKETEFSCSKEKGEG